ncbi:MAG: FAD-dependent oxidoreductase [Clostridiales Family XIII bacterium]|nr:FAD-dependent oxidoreductase [Clostridiales Family XIII bacterium]
MERKYPHLCMPIKIGNVTFKNRMLSAPMGHPDITADGHFSPAAIAFYELRAKGGASVVCCSEGIVHAATGRSHTRMVNLQDEFVLAGLTDMARAIKRHGAVASIEISHGGKFSDVDQLDKSIQKRNLRYGPSDEVLPSGAPIKEMPAELIQEIVKAFGDGAALCKRAGFDMVLLHAGHGWLLHQFLSPISNRRTDAYGGSRENRARFLIEALDSIRAAVGKGFPIELRFSAEEYMEGGNDFEDAIEIAKLIEDKIDLLQVSTGSYENSFAHTHPSMFDPRGCNVHFAAEMKKHVKVPVSTLGALNDPAMMEEILASGKADVVEMARALLADPELPRKVIQGRDEEITRCIRCFTCLAERLHTQTRVCSVNPIIGKELEHRHAYPPTKPKKVLVAGGGPGGMQAAITAAARGHDVTLYEKRDELGGALRCERGIPFKDDFYDLARSKALAMKLSGVRVITGVALTKEIAEREAPDVLVVAVGAEAIVPPLPGIDSPKVVLANDLSEDGVSIGQRVVILGGGLVGCEASVHLAQEGKTVTVVEMLPDVAADANAKHRPILLEEMRKQGVSVSTGTTGLRIAEEGLTARLATGEEKLFPADTVLVAVGQRPLRGVADELLDAAPEVVQVGDCVRPQKVTEALRRGYYAGLDI